MKMRVMLGAVGVAVAIVQGASGLAAEPDATAEQLKAACILNFLKFARWPDGPVNARIEPMRFGLIGEGTPAAAIEAAFSGRTVKGRRLEVLRFPDAAAWRRETNRCDALFVGAGAMREWPEIRAAITNQPILSIADSTGFCAGGGMINLFEKDSRIRFEANPDAAAMAGLELGSGLLKLSVIVRTEVQPK